MPANLENSTVVTRLERVSFHFNPKKGNAKECLIDCIIAHISHASKVKLKILQARLQQYMNQELPDIQAGFRKGRGIRDQIVNIHWITEEVREFQKNIYFCFTDYAKAFDGVDHDKPWKILQGTGIPDHLTCLLRNLYAGQEATGQVKLEPDMKETGSKLGRRTSRLFIVTLLIYFVCRVHHVKLQVG